MREDKIIEILNHQTAQSQFTTTPHKEQSIATMVSFWASGKPSKSGKVQCPSCGEQKFSFNKQHPYKYNCYSCNDNSAVLKALIGLYGKEVGLVQPKKIRPKQRREWVYGDRKRNPLAKYIRIDDGKGKTTQYQEHWDGSQWQKGYGPLKREDIPIYRYSEVKEAITKGETIYIVEGESCADLMWSLGLSATTNIGGSGKWLTSHSHDLERAKVVVLCPDRDVPGVKHMERIARDFPSAQWLYAFPDSPLWSHLPPNQGLDMVDWVEEFKLKKEEILSAIGEKKETKAFIPEEDKPQKPANKVVNHPRYKPIDHEEITAKIDKIINLNLPEFEVTIRLNALSLESGIFGGDLKTVYQKRLSELEQVERREDTRKEIDFLLNVENHEISLNSYIPPELADPIHQICDILGSTPLAMLNILLPTVASLTNPNTRLELIKSTGFYAKPILYSGIVAESGSAKSPTMKTILKPFKRLQQESDQIYQQQLEQYQAELSQWRSQKKTERGSEPTPPTATEYYVNDFTAEAISLIQSNQPDQGFLMEFDELSALVNSQNSYRGGKGSDAEKILSGRDGTGIKVNRASGKRLSNPRSCHSITGGIQRDVLRRQMGDMKDSQGYWSRFLWAVLPIKEAKFPDDEPQIHLSNHLYQLYKRIESMPARDYKLDKEARQLYGDWFRLMEKRKQEEPNQALRAVYSKFKQFTGDLALLLEIIWAASSEEEENTDFIGKEIMKAAIHLSKIYIRQVKLIYGEAEADNGELSPIFKKIVELSNRKGIITAKDVKSGVWSLRKEPAERIRQLFNELSEMGYGRVIGRGRKLSFSSNHQKVEEVDEKLMKVEGVSTLTSTDEIGNNSTFHPMDNLKVEKVEEVEAKTNAPPKISKPVSETKKIETLEETSTSSTFESKTESESRLQKVEVDSTEPQPTSTSSTREAHHVFRDCGGIGECQKPNPEVSFQRF